MILTFITLADCMSQCVISTYIHLCKCQYISFVHVLCIIFLVRKGVVRQIMFRYKLQLLTLDLLPSLFAFLHFKIPPPATKHKSIRNFLTTAVEFAVFKLSGFSFNSVNRCNIMQHVCLYFCKKNMILVKLSKMFCAGS